MSLRKRFLILLASALIPVIMVADAAAGGTGGQGRNQAGCQMRHGKSGQDQLCSQSLYSLTMSLLIPYGYAKCFQQGMKIGPQHACFFRSL